MIYSVCATRAENAVVDIYEYRRPYDLNKVSLPLKPIGLLKHFASKIHCLAAMKSY